MPIRDAEYQNSAGRLLATLDSIPRGQPIIQSVPQVLDVESDNGHEKQQATLEFFVELHKLYIEFRQDMINADITEQQRDTMLSGLRSLEESLYPSNLDGGFRVVTEAERSLLTVCATFIEEEAPLTQNDLQLIRDSISGLRIAVDSGDISPTLERALLELIRLSEDSISRYEIYGARGLKRAFKSMLADAAELYGMTEPGNNREELKESETWDLIIGHLRVFDEIASKLLKYRPLLESASQVLIGGPPVF